MNAFPPASQISRSQLMFRADHVDFDGFRFRGSRPFTLQSTRMLSTIASHIRGPLAATSTPNGDVDANGACSTGGHDATVGDSDHASKHR
jgi:hypothetical protein